MFYSNYYWGMNILWWFIWITLLFWIFALPYDIPGQRKRRDNPLDILQKRLVNSEITQEEYLEKRQLLEDDLFKPR
ncbi:MAG TPA: SHOCT domain-containing protein [Sediminibacterium sp.]|nr:SHOCT domain-containing protein [Sediminibacterium sp.]